MWFCIRLQAFVQRVDVVGLYDNDDVCTPCPAGKTSAQGKDSCTPSPANSQRTRGSQSPKCLKCGAQEYAPEGSAVCLKRLPCVASDYRRVCPFICCSSRKPRPRPLCFKVSCGPPSRVHKRLAEASWHVERSLAMLHLMTIIKNGGQHF